jgi:2-methylisocitrate lyase-like PEP mutase family enzyme
MNQYSAKAATLRSKLDVDRPAVAMSAHNPLAAKLAADAGFDAIWGHCCPVKIRINSIA